MIAAVLPAARAEVTVREMDAREPGSGEVLVRMEACGVCHSDVFVAGLERLPLTPLILGHEGIGRIEAAGPGSSFASGDRVGITFLERTCGACEYCASGLERFCPRQTNTGYTAHGALAELATVSDRHLVRVPEQLAAHEAAPMCCAGWTAYSAVKQAGLAAGRRIAIFGLGGLGHMAIQYARLEGLRVAGVDLVEARLAEARALGAEFTAPAENAGRNLQKELGGMDAALVLTPSMAAVQQAFRSLKRGGTLVLAGLAHAALDLPLVDTVLKGITIRGSFVGTRNDLEQVFQLALTGGVKPRVSTHSIHETPELLERLRRHEISGRAVVVF